MDLALVHIQHYDAWLNDLLIKLGLIEINDYSQIINGHYNDEEDDIDDDEYLRSLDPRNWKEQDHYKIFGLKSKRFFASEQEIKSACILIKEKLIFRISVLISFSTFRSI